MRGDWHDAGNSSTIMPDRILTLTLAAGLAMAALPVASTELERLPAMVQDTTRRPPPKAEPRKPAEKPKPTGTPVLRRRPPPPPPPPRPVPPSPIRP